MLKLLMQMQLIASSKKASEICKDCKNSFCKYKPTVTCFFTAASTEVKLLVILQVQLLYPYFSSVFSCCNYQSIILPPEIMTIK